MTYCFLLKHYRGVTIEKCRAGKPTATRSALLYGDAAGAAEKTARKASVYIYIYGGFPGSLFGSTGSIAI